MNKKLVKLIVIIAIALLVFYGVLLYFGGNIALLLYQALFYGKYGVTFISEIVLLLFSFIVLLISNKASILKPQGKSILYGIKRGIPIFVVSLILLASNIVTIAGEEINIPSFISMIILSITIGMAEEFFFRGFIQSKILDEYGETRKQVIISIIISGAIFGLVHLSNMLSGQDLITTLSQVLQASSLGILLGSIYYLTKNIWSVVFLHAFYDFAILLGEVNTYKDCITNPNISVIMLIFTFVVALIYAVIYLVGAYLNLQRRHVNEHLGEKVTEEIISEDRNNAIKTKKIVVVIIVVLFLSSGLISVDDVDDYQICYDYETTSTKGEVSFSLDEEFILQSIDNTISLTLSVDNYELVIVDTLTDNQKGIEFSNSIYDIYVYEYNDAYNILLNGGEVLYYASIDKINISLDAIDESNFNTYDVPEISNIGKLENSDGTYPLIVTYIRDYFIIKDDKAMVLTD